MTAGKIFKLVLPLVCSQCITFGPKSNHYICYSLMNASENQRGDSAPHFKCLLDCFIHIVFAHIWCIVHDSTVTKEFI